MLLINSTANYFPEELFSSVVSKCLVILDLNKALEKSKQRLTKLDNREKTNQSSLDQSIGERPADEEAMVEHR